MISAEATSQTWDEEPVFEEPRQLNLGQTSYLGAASGGSSEGVLESSWLLAPTPRCSHSAGVVPRGGLGTWLGLTDVGGSSLTCE